MPKVNGYELVCPVCGCKNFEKRSSLLNSRGMTFLGLDWTNQGAINYICESCGYIFWFIDDGREYIEKHLNEMQNTSERVDIDDDMSKPEDDECPICFSKLNKNEKECMNCGYVLPKD